MVDEGAIAFKIFMTAAPKGRDDEFEGLCLPHTPGAISGAATRGRDRLGLRRARREQPTAGMAYGPADRRRPQRCARPWRIPPAPCRSPSHRHPADAQREHRRQPAYRPRQLRRSPGRHPPLQSDRLESQRRDLPALPALHRSRLWSGSGPTPRSIRPCAQPPIKRRSGTACSTARSWPSPPITRPSLSRKKSARAKTSGPRRRAPRASRSCCSV